MYEIEDISEEYGAHGVRCYSVVHNMEFYTLDVRASGYTVMQNDKEININEPIVGEITRAYEAWEVNAAGDDFDESDEWKEIENGQ